MALRQANQYSTEFVIGGTATAEGKASVAFGFEAARIHLVNDSGVPIHYSLYSTGTASTGDPELKADQEITVTGVIVTGIGVMTTSTTTSTAADGSAHRILIDAHGGW